VLAPKWTHAPLSGAGAARHGGRYNAAGTAALYLSEDLLAAIVEYEQELGIRPGTFCAYHVDVSDVVDLLAETSRAALGVAMGDLLAPWQEIAFRGEQPPTWALALRLQKVGVPERECSRPCCRMPRASYYGAGTTVRTRRVIAHDPLSDLPLNQSAWRQ
jgi:RES domain-containing protein